VRKSNARALSPPTPLPHSAGMVWNPVFSTRVLEDIERPGRYRWKISEAGRVRDTSIYSYATKREAQADADKFVEKLNATWRAS
jgi:hypothetical protein